MRRTLILALALVLAGLARGSSVHAQRQGGEPFRCVVTVSTATTIQAVGGQCVAPAPGQSLYVTDLMFSTSAAGIAADAFPTLKYGTGGTCGTGTVIFWGVVTAGAFATPVHLTTPYRLPPANEICWICSTAGSKFLVISGFIAP
jgi:hypothetical protein